MQIKRNRSAASMPLEDVQSDRCSGRACFRASLFFIVVIPSLGEAFIALKPMRNSLRSMKSSPSDAHDHRSAANPVNCCGMRRMSASSSRCNPAGVSGGKLKSIESAAPPNRVSIARAMS